MNKKADGFEGEKLYVLPPYMLDKLNMNPLTKNLYITDIGYFSHARHHFRERMHGCDSHIFIYCASGKGWIRTKDGLTIDMTERSFAYIPGTCRMLMGLTMEILGRFTGFILKGTKLMILWHYLSLLKRIFQWPPVMKSNYWSYFISVTTFY